MNGEHKSRKRRAHGKLPGSLMVRHGQSHCQQPTANEIKKYRIGGVKNKISQVISDRVHSPNQVIKPKSHPTQRLVGTHVKRGKHPANLTPSQTAVVRVAYQILVIVPVNEIVSQGWEKSQKATPMDLPQRVTLLSERPLHSVWPPPPASPEAPEPGPNFLVPRQIRPWFSSRLVRSACASAAVG